LVSWTLVSTRQNGYTTQLSCKWISFLHWCNWDDNYKDDSMISSSMCYVLVLKLVGRQVSSIMTVCSFLVGFDIGWMNLQAQTTWSIWRR
jgi:hypothetical protein